MVKKDLFQFLLVLGCDTIRISTLDLRGTLLLQGIYLDKNSIENKLYLGCCVGDALQIS